MRRPVAAAETVGGRRSAALEEGGGPVSTWDIYVWLTKIAPDAPKQWGEVTHLSSLWWCTGPFVAFGRAKLNDITDLDALIVQLERQSGDDVQTMPVLRLPPNADRGPVNMAQKPPDQAVVRISTEPGTAEDVAARVEGLPGVEGTALVAGDCDVLAYAYGDSKDKLIAVVADAIPSVDHILHTTTCLLGDQLYQAGS